MASGVNVDAESLPDPRFMVICLRAGPQVIRGIVRGDSDLWKDGFVALVDELRRCRGDPGAWTDEDTTALDLDTFPS
jgi:hypothetical protein